MSREHEIPLWGSAFCLSQMRRALQVQILKVTSSWNLRQVQSHSIDSSLRERALCQPKLCTRRDNRKEASDSYTSYIHCSSCCPVSRKASSALRAAWASAPPLCRVPAKGGLHSLVLLQWGSAAFLFLLLLGPKLHHSWPVRTSPSPPAWETETEGKMMCVKSTKLT